MKKNTLLLLASLAVLVSSASAAQSSVDSDVVVLPTYVVNAPRYLSAEKQINTNLTELRDQAKAPSLVLSELPLIKAQVVQHVVPAKGNNSVRVAKS